MFCFLEGSDFASAPFAAGVFAPAAAAAGWISATPAIVASVPRAASKRNRMGTAVDVRRRDGTIAASASRRMRSTREPPVAATPSTGLCGNSARAASASGIIERAAASQRRRVVAAVLPLDADAIRDPGDGRMIEEHRLHDVLHEVDQVIMSANMNQFVGENGLELGGAQSGDQSGRHEHHGLEPADHHRDCGRRREHEPHRIRNAQPRFEPIKPLEPERVGRIGGDAQLADGVPTGQQPQRKHDHAECPQADNPRQIRLDALCHVCRLLRERFEQREVDRAALASCWGSPIAVELVATTAFVDTWAIEPLVA